MYKERKIFYILAFLFVFTVSAKGTCVPLSQCYICYEVLKLDSCKVYGKISLHIRSGFNIPYFLGKYKTLRILRPSSMWCKPFQRSNGSFTVNKYLHIPIPNSHRGSIYSRVLVLFYSFSKRYLCTHKPMLYLLWGS